MFSNHFSQLRWHSLLIWLGRGSLIPSTEAMGASGITDVKWWRKAHSPGPLVSVCVLVTQSCLTVCSPTDYNPPGSSVHGILQVRILEWVAFPFSRGPSPPRDGTRVSRIAGIFFTIWATREAQAPLLNAKGRYQNFSPHGHRVPPCANLTRLTFRDIFPLVPRKLSFLTKAIWITEKFKFC